MAYCLVKLNNEFYSGKVKNIFGWIGTCLFLGFLSSMCGQMQDKTHKGAIILNEVMLQKQNCAFGLQICIYGHGLLQPCSSPAYALTLPVPPDISLGPSKLHYTELEFCCLFFLLAITSTVTCLNRVICCDIVPLLN